MYHTAVEHVDSTNNRPSSERTKANQGKIKSYIFRLTLCPLVHQKL